MITTIEELYSIFCEDDYYISIDSREIEACTAKGVKSIFFAIKGENFNGNDFVIPVIGMGCSYAVTDDMKYEGIDRVFVVKDTFTALTEMAIMHRNYLKHTHLAITGSNGKTTTKELVFVVLSRKYNCYCTKGNLNNHLGVPLTVLRTPKSANFSVIEMGANHPFEIAHLSTIAQPDFGLITNIGRAHLDGFGGVCGIRTAKGELFDYLNEQGGTAFYLSEGAHLAEMVRERTNLRGISYGVADLQTEEGLFLTVKCDNHVMRTNLVGEYNIYNVAAAIAVGRYFGVEESDIFAAIEEYMPTNNRSQLVEGSRNSVIIDAYNANPTSMELAITNFDTIQHENKIMILGEMKELGSYSLEAHIDIFKQIESMLSEVNSVMFVGEEFKRASERYSLATRHNFFSDVEELKCYLREQNIENSLILIKGSNSTKLFTLDLA